MAYATHQRANHVTQPLGKAIAIAAAISLVSGFGAGMGVTALLKASPGSQQSIASTLSKTGGANTMR